MQNQKPDFGSTILRSIFTLSLLVLIGVKVQAQSLDAQCAQFVDIGFAAETLVFELDDLPTLVENLAEVDTWEDEGQDTRALNRKAELNILRNAWLGFQDSLATHVKDWKSLQHLAKPGGKVGRQYSKGSKYLGKASSLFADGAEVIKQNIDTWPKTERQKALAGLQKDLDKILKAVNDFARLSSGLEIICQDCNDSPEDHE